MRELQHSELLHTFLTSKFELTRNFLPELNPLKAIKQVQLGFEKGQNLRNFLHVFAASCETFKNRPRPCDTRSESSKISTLSESIVKEKLEASIFGNNANIEILRETKEKCQKLQLYELILNACGKTYELPNWVMQLILGLKNFSKFQIEESVEKFLESKIHQSFHPKRIEDLIFSLEEILFENHENLSNEKKFQRFQNASEILRSFFRQIFPSIFWIFISEDFFHQSNFRLLKGLQLARLNKQLLYLLADAFLFKIFPELDTDD